jgi:hypothetical protein
MNIKYLHVFTISYILSSPMPLMAVILYLNADDRDASFEL